jgi:hypothetical protein
MKKKLILISLLIIYFACRQRDTTYSEDELVNPESVMSYEEDDTLVLRKMPPALEEWIQYYSSWDTAFALKNFKASGITLHMDVLEDAITSPYETSFADLFIYSPDSSRYIDMVSYNYLKDTIDGKKVLISGDPDQQVVLADRKSGKKKQLMYNGPTQLAEFAAWTSNNSLLIGMTTGEGGIGGQKVELYFFHLKDSSFTNFLLNHPVPTDNLSPDVKDFPEYYFNRRNYEVK